MFLFYTYAQFFNSDQMIIYDMDSDMQICMEYFIYKLLVSNSCFLFSMILIRSKLIGCEGS